MKEIFTASFLATLDEPVSNHDSVSNKEFFAILGMIFGMLSIFGTVVHVFYMIGKIIIIGLLCELHISIPT